MKDEYIRRFYDEVCQNLEGNYKIILEPEREFTEDWIEYDTVKWELENIIQKKVNELLIENASLEKKILELYEYICLNYIYDDNVLYFFKKDLTDINNKKYIAVDWYGRIVEKKWIENRQKHNRRVCYEFARFYAKAINILLDGDNSFEAFMLGDKENLHYVVGLTGKEYSVILDVDDFNKIKDLTRLKLGLTINGISILRDEKGIFKKNVEAFNKNKLNNLPEVEEIKEKFKNKDKIEYFYKVVELLRNFNIDSQGFMEYMKFIIEEKEIETERIWKEVKGDLEKRYVRSIFFNYENMTYLIDSIKKEMKSVKIENLNNDEFILNPEEHEYTYYGG